MRPILETPLKKCDPIIVNPVVKMRPHPAAHPHYPLIRKYSPPPGTWWLILICIFEVWRLNFRSFDGWRLTPLRPSKIIWSRTLLGREVTNGAFPWLQTILKQLEEWHVIVFCDQLGETFWTASTPLKIDGSHMTSSKISLKNYRSSEVFTFMKYKSS